MSEAKQLTPLEKALYEALEQILTDYESLWFSQASDGIAEFEKYPEIQQARAALRLATERTEQMTPEQQSLERIVALSDDLDVLNEQEIARLNGIIVEQVKRIADYDQYILDIFYALNPHKRGMEGQTVAPSTLAGYVEHLMKRLAESKDWERKFVDHTTHVGVFITDLHAIMIDPVEDWTGKVEDLCEALKAAAIRDRENLAVLTTERDRLRAANGKLRDALAGLNYDLNNRKQRSANAHRVLRETGEEGS